MNAARTFAGVHEARAFLAKPLHLAIGMFDGVHLGHQAVIGAAVRSAEGAGGVSAVLTFWPHPSRLFRPGEPVKQLQSPEIRARQLLGLGVAAVITQPFDRAFAALEAEAFLPFLKETLPSLAAIYVGENWRFGRGRRGDVAVLVSEGRRMGIAVFGAPRVNRNGEPISSTRIRSLVETGGIAQANSLLGYIYFAEGTVAPGKRLGRTLGFPTLNVPWNPELVPRLGVYVVRIKRMDDDAGRWLPAVANYGLRPTIENDTQPRLEVHVLGSCDLVEADPVRVEWLSFLRPERKFAGLDALVAQIGVDRARAEAYFSEQPA